MNGKENVKAPKSPKKKVNHISLRPIDPLQKAAFGIITCLSVLNDHYKKARRKPISMMDHVEAYIMIPNKNFFKNDVDYRVVVHDKGDKIKDHYVVPCNIGDLIYIKSKLDSFFNHKVQAKTKESQNED